MSRASGHFFSCNPKARVSVRLGMKMRKYTVEQADHAQESIRRARFVRLPPSADMVIKKGVFGEDLLKKKKKNVD